MLSAAKKASEARLLNRKWVLKARPEGVFSAEACAELAEEHVDLTDLGPEELVVTTEWLAVDAFLRTMLDEGAFHGAVPIGGTLPALGIGVVAAAGARAKLKVGAKCYGMVGAQTVARVTPGELGPWKLMKVPSRGGCDAGGGEAGPKFEEWVPRRVPAVGEVIARQWRVPPPPLYKPRPCPSYSGRRDRINLVPNLIRYQM